MGGTPEIPADVDHVVDISRGTTIGIGDARVHTVEHVMAALVGLQIDNVLIDIDANEPPIGDGSAKPYVEALLKAGVEKQNAPKDYLIIDQTVTYHNEDKKVDIVALPARRLPPHRDGGLLQSGPRQPAHRPLQSREGIRHRVRPVPHVLLPARSGDAAQPGTHQGREPGQRDRDRGPRPEPTKRSGASPRSSGSRSR